MVDNNQDRRRQCSRWQAATALLCGLMVMASPARAADGPIAPTISPPEVLSITRADANPSSASQVRFTVTFDEAVAGVDDSDFVVDSDGDLSYPRIISVSGLDEVWTVTVQMEGGDGTLGINLVDDDSITNVSSMPLGGAGADNGSFTGGEDYTIDHTSPQVVAVTTTAASITNANTINFAVRFSEDMQGFDEADDLAITAEGVDYTWATITGGPALYLVELAGVNGDGTLSLAVDLNSDVTDLAGNAIESSEVSDTLTIDNTAPTITGMVNITNSPTPAQSIQFGIQFDEPITGLDSAEDLVVTDTQLTFGGVTITGGPQEYTVTLTSVTGNGTVSIEVNTATDVADEAGNDLRYSPASDAIEVDQTAPTVASIAPITSSPTDGQSVCFTVTFSEPVERFGATGDVVVNETNVIHTGLTIADGPSVYTVCVTGVRGDGTVSVAVNTDSDVQDAAGNALASTVTSEAVEVDQTGPRATTIRALTTGPTRESTVGFSVAFDVAVTGFDEADDLNVLTEGTTFIGAAISGGPQAYDVYLTGVSGTGSIALAVADGSDLVDAAGNGLIGSVTSDPVTVDNTGPTALTISAETASPTTRETVSFTVVFDEDVVGFDGSNAVTVRNEGVLYEELVIAGGPRTYTVGLLELAGTGSVQISVNGLAGVKDVAGNPFVTGPTSAAIEVDRDPPRASVITPITLSPTSSTSVSFMVQFSEPVVHFDGPGDVAVTTTGPSYTGVTIAGGPREYTATLTGVSGNGELALAINTGSDVSDALGWPLTSSVLSEAVEVDSPPVLNVALPGPAPTALVGDELYTTVTVTNTGGSQATDARLEIPLSAEIELVKADVYMTPAGQSAPITATVEDGTLTVPMGTIPPGWRVDIDLAFRAIASGRFRLMAGARCDDIETPVLLTNPLLIDIEDRYESVTRPAFSPCGVVGVPTMMAMGLAFGVMGLRTRRRAHP